MRLLANVNISPLTVERLRGHGFEILRLTDVMPADTQDRIVLELARSEGRVLISQDLDFSSILALEERTREMTKSIKAIYRTKSNGRS